MANAISHRGPDAAGFFVDAANGLALASRRLAVVDLSANGAQPMRSACGRYVMVFNGEIYNHVEIRRELKKAGHKSGFRGHSDTETLVEAISFWSLPEALDRSHGMFALALWDTNDHRLSLARDRFGEKPLYYGWCGDVFLFGSEIKALRAHPCWRPRIDRSAEALYFQFGYVPGPRSIYKGIGKLPPGTIATLSPGPSEAETGSLAASLLCGPHNLLSTGLSQFWDSRARACQATTVHRSDLSATDELDELLRLAVKRQVLADVAVGTLLSGGIDSSVITAIAQAESSEKVRTFTIGFGETAYDESQHAAAVARHLGTDHTCVKVSPADALNVIPELPRIYDEPFADSSQIPTYLVSQIARMNVTVGLSGDGGDEVFGGYNRHYWVGALWRRITLIPPFLRRVLGSGILRSSPEAWERIIGAMARVHPKLLRHRMAGDKMHKLARALSARDPVEMYRSLTMNRWPERSGLPEFVLPGLSTLDVSERMMCLDLLTYLPDDILVKVDRASMAVSLETRAPFLDHEVVEYAWSLPIEQKIRGNTGKWILRRVLARYVPAQLTERPKMGFGIPIDEWLRGPLRPWAESLLTPLKLARACTPDPAMVMRRWSEHLARKANWTDALWSVLIYHAWLDEYGLDSAHRSSHEIAE